MGSLIKNHTLISIIAIGVTMMAMPTGYLPAILALFAFVAVFMVSYGWMLMRGMGELARELQSMFPDGRLEKSPGNGHGRDHVQISFSRQVEGGFGLAYTVECRKVISHSYERGRPTEITRWEIQSALTIADSGQDGGAGAGPREEGADFVVLSKPLHGSPEEWRAVLEEIPGLGNAGFLMFESPGVREAVAGVFNVGFMNIRFGAKGVVAEDCSSFMDAQDVARAMECLHTIAKARKDLAGQMGFDPLDTEAATDGPCASEAVSDDELYDDIDGGEGRPALPAGEDGMHMDAADGPAHTRHHRLHA